VFTYKVLKGRSGKSYGLKAAALAGVPQAVLDRAAELMAAYEIHGQGKGDLLPRQSQP
jgi:DNA mismatch repair protein MutS